MARAASRVSRVLMTGPLAPFAEPYRLELKERGYTPVATVNELRREARLRRCLEASGLEAAEDSGGAARVDRGVGERDAVLRRRAAVVAALLLHGGACGRRSVAGGAPDHRPAPLIAASGDHQG